MTATATATKAIPASAAATGIPLVDLETLAHDPEFQYRRIVVESARTGNAPGAKELLTINSAMGRSLDQFMRDVKRVQERIAASSAIAEADTRKPEANKLDAVEAEKLRELVTVREECRKRIEAAEREFHAAKHAASVLNQSISDQRKQSFDVLNATSDPAIGVEVARIEREIEKLTELRTEPASCKFEARFAYRFREISARVAGTANDLEQALHPLYSALIQELDSEIDAAEARKSAKHRERHNPERFKLT